MPKNLKKYIDKMQEDRFVQLDYEKAVILAQAQGTALNMPLDLNNPGQGLVQHNTDKELFFSCYISGMKAYFKSKKSINKKHFQRIEQELEHNDSKRTDMKRVLLRFNKEQ